MQIKVLKRETIVFPETPPWWKSQLEVMSGSPQKSPATSATHRLDSPAASSPMTQSPLPSDQLNSETAAIVVQDPLLPLQLDSALCHYVPGVETRWHYHCLVGPGNVFWTTNKVSPTMIP